LPQPTKSIIYSMLGEMYDAYYGINKTKIYRQTPNKTDPDNIFTYDIRRIVDEAIKYYTLSLQEVELLCNEPIGKYRAFLLQDKDVSYQPTLYNLLANRALSFYSKFFDYVPFFKPVFLVNNPDYFADAQTFSNLTIEPEEKLSLSYQSLKTYQELLRFHLKQCDAEVSPDAMAALIDVDLRRVFYLRVKGDYTEKDKLFEEALIRMSKAYFFIFN